MLQSGLTSFFVWFFLLSAALSIACSFWAPFVGVFLFAFNPFRLSSALSGSAFLSRSLLISGFPACNPRAEDIEQGLK